MNNYTCDIVTPITIPELNDVNYAENLSAAFEQINANFAALANHEFIKGRNGDSIKIKGESFFNEDGTETKLAEELKEYIKRLDDSWDITVKYDHDIYNIWNNFTPETAGKIYMIYNTNDDGDEILSTSLHYVFKDGRFMNDKVGIINKAQYNGIKDLSCVLVYTADKGFTALDNAISTIYYNDNLGLCWKINGVETSIPVQGIKGEDGLNSKLYIVKCKSNETSTDTKKIGDVNAIYDSIEGYMNIENFENSLESLNNNSALAIFEDVNNEYFFGTLYVDNNSIKFYCDPNTSLNKAIQTEEINNYFKNIDLMNADNPFDSAKGIIIPFSKNDSESPVHLISSRPAGTYEINDEKLYNDLTIAPVNNINNLRIDDSNEDNKFGAQRFLSFTSINYENDGTPIVYELDELCTLDYIFTHVIGVNLIEGKTHEDMLPEIIKRSLLNGKLYVWKRTPLTDKEWINYVFTSTANPNKNSQMFWYIGIDPETDTLIFEELHGASNISYNVRDFGLKFLRFNTKFYNSFEPNNDATINLDYDVNISRSNKPATVSINGDLIARDIISNNATFNGDVSVGGNFSINKYGSFTPTNVTLETRLTSAKPNEYEKNSYLTCLTDNDDFINDPSLAPYYAVNMGRTTPSGLPNYKHISRSLRLNSNIINFGTDDSKTKDIDFKDFFTLEGIPQLKLCVDLSELNHPINLNFGSKINISDISFFVNANNTNKFVEFENNRVYFDATTELSNGLHAIIGGIEYVLVGFDFMQNAPDSNEIDDAIEQGFINARRSAKGLMVLPIYDKGNSIIGYSINLQIDSSKLLGYVKTEAKKVIEAKSPIFDFNSDGYTIKIGDNTISLNSDGYKWGNNTSNFNKSVIFSDTGFVKYTDDAYADINNNLTNLNDRINNCSTKDDFDELNAKINNCSTKTETENIINELNTIKQLIPSNNKTFKEAFNDIKYSMYSPRIIYKASDVNPMTLSITGASINGNYITFKTNTKFSDDIISNITNSTDIKFLIGEILNSNNDKACVFGNDVIIGDTIVGNLCNTDNSNINVNTNGSINRITFNGIKLLLSSDSQIYTVNIIIESNTSVSA